MVKEGKAAEETATTLVADGVSVSQLSAMNPSRAFQAGGRTRLSDRTCAESSHPRPSVEPVR